MRWMARNTRALISPSPMPITMCTPAIAANPAGQATVPDQASSPAQQMDASTVEHQPANATAATCPRVPGSQPHNSR